MDAFDAGHFNVCGCTGPGNPGDQRRWLLATVEVLGQRFHYLAGSKNAQVPVGEQSEHAPAFSVGVVEDNGSRFGDAAKGCCDHAFSLFDLSSGEAVIDFPVEA